MNDNLHIIGDSHVVPDIWKDICGINNVTSYPGFKTYDILNIESMILENKTNVLLVSGTNDCLSLFETLELFENVQKDYDYIFHFVLPFNLTESYMNYYKNKINKNISLIVFEDYNESYLSEDRVHLTLEGNIEFVKYINSHIFNNINT